MVLWVSILMKLTPTPRANMITAIAEVFCENFFMKSANRMRENAIAIGIKAYLRDRPNQ